MEDGAAASGTTLTLEEEEALLGTWADVDIKRPPLMLPLRSLCHERVVERSTTRRVPMSLKEGRKRAISSSASISTAPAAVAIATSSSIVATLS